MARRSTWILLFTFLILLIGTVIMEKSLMQQNQQNQTLTETPTLFPGWSSNMVNGLIIKNSEENELIALKRNHQGMWVLDASPNQTVDQGIVEELISTLLSLKPLYILDETLPPDTLGLETPYLSIELTDIKNRKITLQIGAITPIRNGYYACINFDHQYVISANTAEALFYLSTVKAITQQ